MALTNAGRDFIAGTIIDDGTPTYFNNANSHIAVGSGTTAFAPADAALETELDRQPMEATYPLITGNILTFRSVFATTEANGAWEEWGVFNAAAAGLMLNRKVESLGTKTSAQTWQITVDITVNNP